MNCANLNGKLCRTTNEVCTFIYWCVRDRVYKNTPNHAYCKALSAQKQKNMRYNVVPDETSPVTAAEAVAASPYEPAVTTKKGKKAEGTDNG